MSEAPAGDLKINVEITIPTTTIVNLNHNLGLASWWVYWWAYYKHWGEWYKKTHWFGRIFLLEYVT